MEAIIPQGTGMLAAQSFSIQVSDRTTCNAKCRFCISRCTPNDDVESQAKVCDDRRLRVGLNLAKRLGATHAILTGKADPTQEDGAYLCNLAKTAREYVPLVDMHTNGLLLDKKPGLLYDLADSGLTMVTYSIASFDHSKNRMLMGVPQTPSRLIDYAIHAGLLVRCSLVMNKQGVTDFDDVMSYVRSAGSQGAHMVVIREVWVPEVYGSCNREVFEWNCQNKVPIGPIEDMFKAVADDPKNEYGLKQRDPLPWGTPVFVVDGFGNDHGVNITFARCDEATRGPVIKSIVHKPNGHGYRNWDHHGDILY